MNPLVKTDSKFRLTPLSGGMIVVALLLTVYVGTYAVRSKDGRFEPFDWGLAGPKSYRWAPAGFVNGYKWDLAQVKFYYPLFILDANFWHDPYSLDRNKYPWNLSAERE